MGIDLLETTPCLFARLEPLPEAPVDSVIGRELMETVLLLAAGLLFFALLLQVPEGSDSPDIVGGVRSKEI